MNKPASLRLALIAALPMLQRDPDKLHIFIDQGQIISSGAPSLSFEYRYILNAIVTDYSEHPDSVVVPILAWLREQQPDMALNPERMLEGFSFEADILNHSTIDLSIKLKLSERVGVRDDPVTGQRVVTHFEEPPLGPYA